MLLLTLFACVHATSVLEGPRGVAPLATQPTAQSGQARFVVIGDVGVWSGTPSGEAGAVVAADLSPKFRAVAANVRAVCAAEACDFVVLTGDNIYPNGVGNADHSAAFGVMLAELGLPAWVVLGNHDWRFLTPNRSTAARELDWIADHEGVSGSTHLWSVQAGPVAIWGLDSNLFVRRDATVDAPELDAFLHELARDRRHPWKLAVAHHTVFSNGEHGDAGHYRDGGLRLWAGAAWAEVLDQRVLPEVDLFLSGHDHNLQFFDAGGTGIMVSGAGAKCAGPGQDPGRFAEGRPEPAMLHFERGFSVVEATEEELRVRFYSGSAEPFFKASRGVDDAAWRLPGGTAVEAAVHCG
jgi:tartrate-resistant acid phosphatase type 5